MSTHNMPSAVSTESGSSRDRGAILFENLHRMATRLTGGSVSVLLEFNEETRALHLTSATGLAEPLPTWHVDAGDARELETLVPRNDPSVVSDLGERQPSLARLLNTPDAILAPLGTADSHIGLLVIGIADGADASAALEPSRLAAAAFTLALEGAAADRRERLRALARHPTFAFSRAVSAGAGVDTALDTFVREALPLSGARRISVWFHEREVRQVVLKATSDGSVATGTRLAADDQSSLVVQAMRQEHALIANGDGRYSQADDGKVVAVPLRGRRRALGTILFEGMRFVPNEKADLLQSADELGREFSSTLENIVLLEQLVKSRRELENTFNSIADLVVVFDPSLHIKRVNLAFVTRIGRLLDSVIDQPLSSFLASGTLDWISGLDLSSQTATGTYARESDDPILAGTFSMTVTPFVDGGSLFGGVLVARDITAQAQMEANQAVLRGRLAQSEKLAALGQFVAGIAHELNNPLQGVLGHLELLRVTKGFPKQIGRDLRVVYREANRAAKIVRNLLVFAGSHRLRLRRLSLNGVMTRALAFRVSFLKAAGIEVVRDYREDLPFVYGDPLFLQQAFLNILMNAEQALETVGGGRIEVRTRLAHRGRTIATEIRDTGPGIPDDILPRVFEPFYTTKEVGKGTGLGLAITYGIIQDHGGQVVAANHPDGGAIFTVELPAGKEVIE